MTDLVMQLGVGGAFALLMVREVLGFLRGRESARSDRPYNEMRQQIRDLHEWHAVQDQDGVKVWYVRRSLEDAVERLASTIEKLAETQRAEFEVLREMARDMRDLRRAVNRE